VEFKVGKGSVKVYHLDADGELVAAATHQDEDDAAAPPVTAMQRR